jgi:hypothetical protein
MWINFNGMPWGAPRCTYHNRNIIMLWQIIGQTIRQMMIKKTLGQNEKHGK